MSLLNNFAVPFSVSKYLERIERAALDIVENKEPVDHTIILWWGLDGLRLNENGTIEAVSRKKQKSELAQTGAEIGGNATVFYADNAPVLSLPIPSISPVEAALLACAIPAQCFVPVFSGIGGGTGCSSGGLCSTCNPYC